MDTTSTTIEKIWHVRTGATVSKWFSPLWFEYFTDLIDSGAFLSYEFLEEVYTFDSLQAFIEGKDGINADPINLYNSILTCTKNPETSDFANRLLAKFDECGFDPIKNQVIAHPINPHKRPPTIDKQEIIQAYEQNPGATQREIAEVVGCGHRTVGRIVDSLGHKPDSIRFMTQHDKPPSPQTRSPSQYGTSSFYLQQKLAAIDPNILDNIGKGKQFSSVSSAATHYGVVKKSIRIDVKVGITPEEYATKLIDKFDKQFLTALAQELSARLSPIQET